MEIVERNMVGKKSQEACEDGVVVTDDFIAVIDGSTSKTPTHLSPDMKNGRYAMVLISELSERDSRLRLLLMTSVRVFLPIYIIRCIRL